MVVLEKGSWLENSVVSVGNVVALPLKDWTSFSLNTLSMSAPMRPMRRPDIDGIAAARGVHGATVMR